MQTYDLTESNSRKMILFMRAAEAKHALNLADASLDRWLRAKPVVYVALLFLAAVAFGWAVDANYLGVL